MSFIFVITLDRNTSPNMTESEKGLQVVPLKSSALEAVERSTHSKQYRDLPMHVNIAKLHNWMVADANYEQYILKR